MKKEQIITCDEEIVSGTPVFAGTRVPVAILIDYLKAGDSLERFLEGFPTGTRAQAFERFLTGLSHSQARTSCRFFRHGL